MLFSIANKAGQEIAALDQAGVQQKFKLLNTQYLGIRKLHTDVQGVTPAVSGIVNGTILTMPNGDQLTVSMVTVDYYRGKPIRNSLDMVENNNRVTVIRQTVTKSFQGGITGKTDATIYTNVPVKIGTVLQVRDLRNDTTDSQFGMLLSVLYPVKIGDRLEFQHTYEPAKVEGIKLNYEGIYEISFDKDPRWT